MNSPTEKEPYRMAGVDKTIKIFETISIICLIGISIVVMGQILLRNLFSIGFPWADELSRLLHIALIFLMVPILYRERALFKIDLFVKRLPMAAQIGFRFFSIAVCIGFCIFFMISFTEFMRGSWDVPSPALRVPNLVFFGSIFLGVAGLLGVSIERLIHEIKRRKEKRTK